MFAIKTGKSLEVFFSLYGFITSLNTKVIMDHAQLKWHFEKLSRQVCPMYKMIIQHATVVCCFNDDCFYC
jgi:hypothetical protein